MTLLCREPRSGAPNTRSRVGFSDGSAANDANDAIPSARHRFSLASAGGGKPAWYVPDQPSDDHRTSEGASIAAKTTFCLMGERAHEGILPTNAEAHKIAIKSIRCNTGSG